MYQISRNQKIAENPRNFTPKELPEAFLCQVNATHILKLFPLGTDIYVWSLSLSFWLVVPNFEIVSTSSAHVYIVSVQLWVCNEMVLGRRDRLVQGDLHRGRCDPPMQWVETHAQPYQHYSGLKGPFDPGCFTPRQIFQANWKSIVQDGKCCIEFEKKVVFIQSARNTVPSSLKTSILKKLVPIYFIRILKAVTKQSINNLEYAAFLILPVEIKFFSFCQTFFSFKDTSGGTIMETKSHWPF